MSNQSEGNADWIKREQGRLPSKGAAAAERASAGLGTSDDDSLISKLDVSSPISLWSKPVPKKPPAEKR